MMRAKAKGTFPPPPAMRESCTPVQPAAAAAKEDEWEVRPGGMLVQKRSPESDAPAAPVPTIRVKVKFNGVYHEIYVNSQASFGELKKLLSAQTGLHPEDQKIVYKDKERDSKAFLDMAGVKDRSKMVLLEDPAAQAKRLLEQRRTDKAERAAKSISRIGLDVDKIAAKVTALEGIVAKGGKVVDADVVTLTEALMNELVKLDAIAAEGEVKVQRRMQEKRVQKYVESLDAIRAKNAAAHKANGNGHHAKAARAPHLPPRPPPVSQRRQFQAPPAAHTAPKTTASPAPAPPTASWESFDLLSSTPSTSSSTVTTTMAAATTTSPIPRFDWELF
ncbi:BAG family molecular chaperone regulator 3 [Oryza brachyantha]|uniref:BAG domain-containing protein n=1 Tax=Oryza brachyantha TaxID=4533 RepID=A6MD01_ORYBR|nr:BAG family molecular chaperone regulator 3 [Oryza brachyantha]ABG73438.1 BAG domain-containing protein [Oryza brachyantha]